MMLWWHMKTWYSLHAGGYLQQTSRAAVRQTLNMFIRGSEQICRTMIEVSFSYNICIKVINEQSEAYSYTLTQFIQQQNRLKTHFWLNTAQWKKMKRYLRCFAEVVVQQLVQWVETQSEDCCRTFLLWKLRAGPQDFPPLSILMLDFRKHSHLLAGKGSLYWLFVAVLKVPQNPWEGAAGSSARTNSNLPLPSEMSYYRLSDLQQPSFWFYKCFVNPKKVFSCSVMHYWFSIIPFHLHQGC